jgi:glycosyltransferase involved in cell wall biosynthesis
MTIKRKIGVIVEWDNARLSDVERAREMLMRLTSQAREIADRSSYTFELLLIYDPEEIPAEVPETVVGRCVDRSRWPGCVRILQAPSLSYYAQKNFGVTQTDADIIVFVDSDVVPDHGWLQQLLSALDNPEVEIVAGETYLATGSFYERLCAAFWMFDVRRDGEGIYASRRFYANNVALRREIAEQFPFPEAETFRGQCATLGRELRSRGLTVHKIRSAAVSHPPPEGLRHFIRRGICHGHDTLLNQSIWNKSAISRTPIGSAFRFARGIARAPFRIWRRHRQAQLGPIGMFAAFGLSAVYSGLILVGELVTFLSPGYVRKRFSI